MADQNRISPFYLLLSTLSQELMKCELQQALLLCSNQGIKPDKLRVDDPTEFFRVLIEAELIGEDNTHFLKEILEASGYLDGKTAVEEYERKRHEHSMHVESILGKKDPYFVGRVSFVSRILQMFNDCHNKCRIVLVYGLAGTGKTKLACESCAVYKMKRDEEDATGHPTRILRVNLRKATSVEEVGLWILNSVTNMQITRAQFDLALVRNWVRACSQDTILLLDNADDILSPSSGSRSYFINTLTDLSMIQNSFVKLLITSRHPVVSKNIPNFLAIKLEPLMPHESLQFLNKMVKKSQQQLGTVNKEVFPQDEMSLLEIARLCGNNPQALRAVASRLSCGFIPADLVRHLQQPDLLQRVLDPGCLSGSAAVQNDIKSFEDNALVLKSLDAMYEQLPEKLKEALLRLSVFPTSFSLSQGATILGTADVEAAKYDLEDLKKWSLVEDEPFDLLDTSFIEKESHYYIHPLVRSVALIKMSESDIFRVAYEDALRSFMGYIADMLHEVSLLGHRDFSQALKSLDLNKTNVLHFLELDMGNKFGCKVIADARNVNSVPLPENKEGLHSMFAMFLDPVKRLEYFKNKSEILLAEEKIEAWAYLRAWAGDELVFMAKYDEVEEVINEPLRILKQRQSGTNDWERAVAQLTYVRGRMLANRRRYKEALGDLLKALEIFKRVLGVHSVTARCLNALGYTHSCMIEEDHRFTDGTDEALRYHKEAWKMLGDITNNHPQKHFDAPMYLLNIGTVYHQMGQKSWNRKKANAYYELAIRNYEEAHQLERDLKMANSPNATSLMKNMAMSYCEMKEYEKALPLALSASEIRLKTFEVHPLTARSLYFVGSLYQSIAEQHTKKDQTAMLENYSRTMNYYGQAFLMEAKLGKSRRSKEYEYLKEDIKTVLTAQHMDRELTKYKRLFTQADKGNMVSEDDVMPEAESEGTEGTEEASVMDSVDGTAGPSRRRKAPGPVYSDNRQDKRVRCSLS